MQISKPTPHSGLGAICRNDSGDVLGTATWKHAGSNNPVATKAFEMYMTMDFAAQCCFLDVIFESDNKKIIRVLNGKEEIPNIYVVNIIRGIQYRMVLFRQVYFKYVGRKGNVIAHKLA